MKADGLEDGYKVLVDFNGTVLAGVQSKYGVHFVTWDWAYGHTGVCHGHYFMENYAGAKQDFVIRSGLIQKEQLFSFMRPGAISNNEVWLAHWHGKRYLRPS